MAAVSEAQHVIDLSLKKIVAWRSKRGGIDLHRNLLLASVLLKARNACVVRPCYLDTATVAEDDVDITETCDSLDDVTVTLDEVASGERLDDVTVTSDDVPSCEESKNVCPDATQVRWDVIPDQALEEWDFLGSDICGEQLNMGEDGTHTKLEISKLSEDEENKETTVDILPLEVLDCNRTSDFVNSHSKKRTLEIEVGHDSENLASHKRQRIENTVNCESLCMDFDDLMSSLEVNCSQTDTNIPETSHDPLGFLLESSFSDSSRNYFGSLDGSVSGTNESSLSCHQDCFPERRDDNFTVLAVLP